MTPNIQDSMETSNLLTRVILKRNYKKHSHNQNTHFRHYIFYIL